VKLAELGEFGLIDRIARRVPPAPGVLIGIGDDAASVCPEAGAVSLLTSDMLVEGVHFDLATTDPARLGRKSLSVNLSDIAAMGGIPRYVLLSLAIPPTLSAEFMEELVAGVTECAGRFGVTLVGGDTCAAQRDLVLSITVMGEQRPDRVVGRNGARPGELVFVTGCLGDSALGLRELQAGTRVSPAIDRHLDPLPRVEAGRQLAEAGIPTAMIDVSDGLLADLGHILDRSGCGAELESDLLPLSPYFRETAARHHAEPLELALAGGEDYELLFTAPPEREPALRRLMARTGLQVTGIGRITAEPGVRLRDRSGAPVAVSGRGYRHF
jgi:thiamine-monophosphate kinase